MRTARRAVLVSTAEELDALPVGARIEGRMPGDDDAYWLKDVDGWHMVRPGSGSVSRAWKSSDLFFSGINGRRITRKVFAS